MRQTIEDILELQNNTMNLLTDSLNTNYEPDNFLPTVQQLIPYSDCSNNLLNCCFRTFVAPTTLVGFVADVVVVVVVVVVAGTVELRLVLVVVVVVAAAEGGTNVPQ